MNLAVIFDPHFWTFRRHGGPLVKGINRRGSLCLDVGRRVVETANRKSASLIVAGDLVDSAGPVSPQFAHALRETLGECGQSVTLMLGNHDMTADGDHSLGVYTQRDDWTDVQVCDDICFSHGSNFLSATPLGLDDVCLVPFHRDIRDARVRDVPLVIAHFGVYDDSFPAWAKKAKGAWHVNALLAFMKERNIKCLLAGDWHGRAIWNKRNGTVIKHSASTTCISEIQIDRNDSYLIMQGGALCPTGFDNPGLHGYGTLAFWDTDEHRLSWQEMPGPRFCVARSEEEEQAIIEEARRLKHNLFLRRYYEGERPATPPGLEAYEALPAIVERAAAARIPGDLWPSATPQQQAQLLVSHWLETLPMEDQDFITAYMARLL